MFPGLILRASLWARSTALPAAAGGGHCTPRPRLWHSPFQPIQREKRRVVAGFALCDTLRTAPLVGPLVRGKSPTASAPTPRRFVLLPTSCP